MRKIIYVIRQTAYSLFSFCYFLCVAMGMTLYGFCLLTLGGASEEHKKKYHEWLQRIARFTIYHVPGTTFKYLNKRGETFGKQAVIISNHQSHLDLMAIMMLTPNLIILTKNWVWHNPFYGIIIRYADFFPMSDTEEMTRNLRDMVAKGYSVMIFPEGTRSADCHIQRFHRGAFYLAEQLHLDILPVFIDGFGKVLPKTSFSLHPGAMTMEVLPRIERESPDMEGYREMARRLYAMYVNKKQ